MSISTSIKFLSINPTSHHGGGIRFILADGTGKELTTPYYLPEYIFRLSTNFSSHVVCLSWTTNIRLTSFWIR